MPTPLERMLAAAAQDPAERPAFTQALLTGHVYVLGGLGGPTVSGVVQPGTNAQLANFVDSEGPFVPFFTSETAMQASLSARPGTRPNYLVLQCRALFEMTTGSRLVLNPDGPNGKIYLPFEIDALVAGLAGPWIGGPFTSCRGGRRSHLTVVGLGGLLPKGSLGAYFIQREPRAGSLTPANPHRAERQRNTVGPNIIRC